MFLVLAWRLVRTPRCSQPPVWWGTSPTSTRRSCPLIWSWPAGTGETGDRSVAAQREAAPSTWSQNLQKMCMLQCVPLPPGVCHAQRPPHQAAFCHRRLRQLLRLRFCRRRVSEGNDEGGVPEVCRQQWVTTFWSRSINSTLCSGNSQFLLIKPAWFQVNNPTVVSLPCSTVLGDEPRRFQWGRGLYRHHRPARHRRESRPGKRFAYFLWSVISA